jgi:hypothetical protein
VAPALIPAATRNVLAHLIDLWARNEIACAGGITPTRGFTCAEAGAGRDAPEFSRAPSGQQKTQLLCDRPVPA